MRSLRKQLGIFIIILIILTSFIGCGKAAQPKAAVQPAIASTTSPNTETAVTAAPTAAPTATPTATPTPTSTQQKPTEDKKTEDKNNSSENTTKTVEIDTKGKLCIKGSGLKQEIYFSLEDLKAMASAYVDEDYFALNSYGTKKYFHFKGASLWYILSEKAGLTKGDSKVTITAEDGYSVEYTLEDVKKNDYIDEQKPDKKLKMIIAWEENGKEYDKAEGNPFKLVVGQKEAGDVNKPNWVQNISTIIVE